MYDLSLLFRRQLQADEQPDLITSSRFSEKRTTSRADDISTGLSQLQPISTCKFGLPQQFVPEQGKQIRKRAWHCALPPPGFASTVRARDFQAWARVDSFSDMAGHGTFRWVRPEVYPLLAALGVGVGAMVVALKHSIFSVC